MEPGAAPPVSWPRGRRDDRARDAAAPLRARPRLHRHHDVLVRRAPRVRDPPGRV